MELAEVSNLGGNCPICNGALVLFDTNRDRHIVKCEICRLLVVEEGLYRLGDGQSIYEADESIFFVDGNQKYYEDKNNTLSAKEKLDFVRRNLQPGSHLLDAGAGFGFFVKVAQDYYDVRGVEVAPAAVQWSRANLHVNCERGNIYSLSEQFPKATKFDAITLWDVIEHLHDPRAALRVCRRMLRSSGQLYISTQTPEALWLVCWGTGGTILIRFST